MKSIYFSRPFTVCLLKQSTLTTLCQGYILRSEIQSEQWLYLARMCLCCKSGSFCSIFFFPALSHWLILSVFLILTFFLFLELFPSSHPLSLHPLLPPSFFFFFKPSLVLSAERSVQSGAHLRLLDTGPTNHSWLSPRLVEGSLWSLNTVNFW